VHLDERCERIQAVLPILPNVPIRVMSEATGLSRSQCQRFLSGKTVPKTEHLVILEDPASGEEFQLSYR
jgi:hypothetical protein